MPAAGVQLSDERTDRTAPEVTSAGTAGSTARRRNGPVALDARTGEDAPPSPGIAPVPVNGSEALALEQEDGRKDNLFVFAATG